MVIAADPKKLPMGTRVLIQFYEPEWQHYNGIYTVRDVGGGVKGNVIDMFMGDFNSNREHPSLNQFGRRKAKVTVLK